MRRSTLACACLLMGGLHAACGSPTDPNLRYRVPVQTSDGWQTASVASVGMDARPLEDLLDLVDGTPGHLLHGLLIVKDGKLVFEEYWPGVDLTPESLELVERDFDRETLHYVASVSKSITSALAGIALDQGLTRSVQDPVFSYFPEHEDLRSDTSAQVTLEHLLSFSSGWDWNEHVYGFDDPRDSHYQMFNAADPVRQLLGRPFVSAPGSTFFYNSGDANLLGEIARRASGSATLVDFARARLFGPLGIERFEWVRFGPGSTLTFASGGASLRPRDMAKLGLLYLRSGTWEGRQIVSRAWVDASTRMSVPLVGDHRTLYGYGYNWWLGRSPFRGGRAEYFRAAGWGGQYIYVYPGLNLVLVFTAGAYYDDLGLSINDIIEEYVFAAINR
ncbi:MAG TPA: serine hydrolase [Longimicrobiales bacterium]|nr:serine hydrolase [Longimicrobiales bacterium]